MDYVITMSPYTAPRWQDIILTFAPQKYSSQIWRALNASFQQLISTDRFF